MANNNMYDLHHHTTTPFCSSPSEPVDDISIFLQQILFKSSSSSSTSCSQFVNPKQMQCQIRQQQLLPDSLSFAGDANIPVNVVGHVSSSSVGTGDYEQDEYDCESEERLENLMEEMIAKPNPGRNTTKRTRAAEVHNMSEKRRRSRINEKMKALQKLIPNSNKSDKASMLDEAIEYLKQLQLQVQALTMRNGINWYSMCAPHLEPNQNDRPSASGIYQGMQAMNMPVNQERLVTMNPMLSQNQPSILDFSRTINQGPSFGTQLGSS